jgi:hypothetical protein
MNIQRQDNEPPLNYMLLALINFKSPGILLNTNKQPPSVGYRLNKSGRINSELQWMEQMENHYNNDAICN